MVLKELRYSQWRRKLRLFVKMFFLAELRVRQVSQCPQNLLQFGNFTGPSRQFGTQTDQSSTRRALDINFLKTLSINLNQVAHSLNYRLCRLYLNSRKTLLTSCQSRSSAQKNILTNNLSFRLYGLYRGSQNLTRFSHFSHKVDISINSISTPRRSLSQFFEIPYCKT